MKILFEDGDWRLIDKHAGIDIQHHCSQPFGDSLWWYYAYDSHCGVCHEPIPEPILGLWNLHRWDR